MTATRIGSYREASFSYATVDDILLHEYGIKEIESMQQLGAPSLAQIIVLNKLNQKELEKKIAINLKGSLGGK